MNRVVIVSGAIFGAFQVLSEFVNLAEVFLDRLLGFAVVFEHFLFPFLEILLGW